MLISPNVAAVDLRSSDRATSSTAEIALTIIGNSFKDGDDLAPGHIVSADFGFGCAGGNRSPHLAWSGAPAGAKSFATTCDDPDAPTGSGFWHWLVVNIPADVTELALDAGNPDASKLPVGALQTRTDVGKPGYGGPCPREGDHPHRYWFTVFAVGAQTLPLVADTRGSGRLQPARQHIEQSGDFGPVQTITLAASREVFAHKHT